MKIWYIFSCFWRKGKGNKAILHKNRKLFFGPKTLLDGYFYKGIQPWDLVYFVMFFEKKKIKPFRQKHVYFAWAQKTSEIPFFTIGVQQWRSHIFFMFLEQNIRKLEPFWLKLENVRFGPKNL